MLLQLKKRFKSLEKIKCSPDISNGNKNHIKSANDYFNKYGPISYQTKIDAFKASNLQQAGNLPSHLWVGTTFTLMIQDNIPKTIFEDNPISHDIENAGIINGKVGSEIFACALDEGNKTHYHSLKAINKMAQVGNYGCLFNNHFQLLPWFEQQDELNDIEEAIRDYINSILSIYLIYLYHSDGQTVTPVNSESQNSQQSCNASDTYISSSYISNSSYTNLDNVIYSLDCLNLKNIGKFLANTKPTIYRNYKPNVIAACQQAFIYILDALEHSRVIGDSLSMEKWYKRYLLLPTILFTVHGKSNSADKIMIDRVNKIVVNDWSSFSINQFIFSPHRKSSKLSDEKLKNKRIEKLVSRGLISKALQTLLSDPLPPISSSTIEKHEALHAQPSTCFSISESELSQVSIDLIVYESNEVSRQIRNLKKGSAPGITGLRGEHLKALLSQTIHEDKFLDAYTKFVNNIANAVYPQLFINTTSQCIEIGIPKESGGIRPIALSDVTLKVVGKLIAEGMYLLKDKLFGNLQFGVGNKFGMEYIIHNISSVQELHPEYDIACFDIMDAFGSISRSALLNIIKSSPELNYLYPYFFSIYSQPTGLWLRTETEPHYMESTSGIRQGDSLSTLLFAIGYQMVLNTVKENLVNGISVAYVDDSTIAAKSCDIISIIPIFRDAAANFGLKLNDKKTKILISRQGICEDILKSYHDILPLASHNNFIQYDINKLHFMVLRY